MGLKIASPNIWERGLVMVCTQIRYALAYSQPGDPDELACLMIDLGDAVGKLSTRIGGLARLGSDWPSVRIGPNVNPRRRAFACHACSAQEPCRALPDV